MNTIAIESSSVETVKVTYRADQDPTGDAVAFLVTADTVTTPTGTWYDGTWGEYANGKVVATTPSLGLSGSATLTLTEGTPAILWARVGGTGGVIERACRIVVL